jgi:CheY-like chemotaxis protein
MLEASMSAPIKLLIVDDEPATRKLLATIFGKMGHSVRTAEDGFTALEQIREAMPDVLLSDLHMPGMSGFELLSIVRRRLPGIYVIATSGAYRGEDVPYGIAADAFYEKATGFKSLIHLMETATTGKGLFPRNVTASAPVWVTLTDSEPLSEESVMICCPECMRASAQVAGKGLLLIHETGCEYCQTKIRYAVVQALDPLTSQPYHPILAETLKPIIPVELLRHAEAVAAQDDLMVA